MRVKTFYRVLRLLSAVVLFFFIWTFGPVWQAVAFAATSPKADAKAQTIGKPETGKQKAEERFEGVLAEMREKVARAGEKHAKGGDDSTEREALKAGRASIDQISEELRAEFSSTEKRLKTAGLPKEILARHADFVAHFERNVKELHDNLDGIESAKTKAGRGAKIGKARLHLEKTKKPSTHQKLDPNRLPHQNRVLKTKWREPRTKEQYERDFPQQKSQSKKKIADSRSWHDLLANAPKQKPILLAFNEFASDIPLSLGVQSATPQLAFSDPSLFLLAQTADAPNAADLAETVEVQFTQDIRDLAAQLGNKPAKIFEWIRNNIEFVPTYGSIQGADMCLQTRQCNAFDTASLLIALLRTSNLPARYVYGTVEIPIDKIMNWVGGFTAPMAAATLVASGGIPVRPYIVGSKIAKVQMEHVWVETYIPYGNYRGAIMDQSIKTWIPMDGSFKTYEYTPGFDITPTVSFSQNDYLGQIQSQNPVHYYQSRIQEYLDANMPETSIIDVKGYREIKQEKYPFLSSTLPYKTIVRAGVFSNVPAGSQAKAVFSLPGASLAFTVPEIAGKRITLSYIPATAADETLISNYGGYIYGVPAYLLNLKPVLKIDGIVKLTGDAATMGAEQALTLQLSQPKGLSETVQKKLIAGAYYAIGLDLQGINENVLGKRNYTLTTNVLSETAGTLGNDDLIGELLYLRAVTYFLANDKVYRSGAKLFNTVVTRTLSEGITSFTLSVAHVFSIPKTVNPTGVEIDVAMDRIIAVARDGNLSKEKAYTEIAGLTSSYHEHDIFERIDGYSSVSTVRALQVASANGMPIYKINASNISQTLPSLQVGPEIKQDILNAVNAGREVTISQANVQVNDWNGVGYIVKDPVTGSGTYRITGGLAGGSSTSNGDGMQIVQLHKEPLGWVKDNVDPQTRNTIATVVQLEIGEHIAQAAVDLIPQYPPEDDGYNKVGTCVGVVRKAYKAAGICLDEWSGCPMKESVGWKNGIRWVEGRNGVRYLYDLANKLNINESVSKDRDPLIGDMVFFKYTNAEDIRDHIGVVISVADSNGTITFVDATSSSGVSMKNMNLLYPNVGMSPTLKIRLNHPLLVNPSVRGKYAGDLFDGFATVRDTAAQPQNSQ